MPLRSAKFNTYVAALDLKYSPSKYVTKIIGFTLCEYVKFATLKSQVPVNTYSRISPFSQIFSKLEMLASLFSFSLNNAFSSILLHKACTRKLSLENFPKC